MSDCPLDEEQQRISIDIAAILHSWTTVDDPNSSTDWQPFNNEQALPKQGTRIVSAERFPNEAQISGSRSGLRALGRWMVGLLVVAYGQFGGDRFDVAKEAACAMVGACGEIELGGG